jgi:hypothetical protein
LDEQSVYHEDQYRLFIETKRLLAGVVVEDGWYPFLPLPGKYKHPTYGEVNITRAGNQALVDSVQNRVYQEYIPIDAEHQTKLSGAVAWLRDMRLNEDGSADALLEWTDRGRTLVSGGQFKYFSPEFFGTWPDPATGVVHKNVVAGGAITTRPFFKDKVLRALVASEDGTEIIQQETFADMKKCAECSQPLAAGASGPLCADCAAKASGAGGSSKPPFPPKKMGEDTDPPTPTPEDSKQMSEEAIQAKIDAAVEAARKTFSDETSTKFTELGARVEAAEALATAEKARADTFAEQLKVAADKDRARRFHEVVSGKGSADGAAWAGDPAKQLAILTKLAEAFGEDSDEVKSYIEQQTAIAVQLQTTVFKEYGTGRPASNGESPADKLDALAKAHADKTGKDFAVAYSEVIATDEGVRLYSQI